MRSAVPPVVTAGPSRDLWPLVVKQSQERPEWSWLDVGLAAGVIIALLIWPELLMLLAYHF
ncbi:MAG: hypothetical protein HYS05_22300 [Acidobacteria bacterium]|nr:hypothetical protein [Acidobacteriota bacterium]